MDNIIKKLSDIEQAAEAVVAHAEDEKKSIEQEMQKMRDQFDEELEQRTQEKLQIIRDDMTSQMEEILGQQARKNQEAIEQVKKDFGEKHTIYAKDVIKNMIEG